ncbi:MULTISPECIES: hypothetical protein [unclassified Pseudonocardia]|uniref:hypothetical protein n=1 Tax=unclassified Pseudonocardia TaxID=2619320 RepID=UPI0001FFE4A3|nr:hypothetical protein [Pseudonocardia sp. Ae707_Ps1]OLM16755.1 hypothetical protein Ae707Ps1_1013 [Pseudonocardia sp. Ae707_Ps1]
MKQKLGAPFRWFAGLAARRPGAVVGGLVTVVVVLAAATATLFVLHFRHQADESATAEAHTAADSAVAELLTYDPETIGKSVDRYAGLVTGPFGDDYTRLLKEVVVPAAERDKVATKTDVTASSVIGEESGTVNVLMFLNQTSQSASAPAGAPAGSRVRVAMENVDGAWKISGFTPL